jgi:anti-anti-sigma factor
MSGEHGTLRIDHVDRNGTWLIALEGEHDTFTVDQFDAQTAAIWPNCSRAIVDLSTATFIDSTVLSWLLHARSRVAAGENGGNVAIVESPGCFASRLLDITGLRDTFVCFPSRTAALAFDGEGVRE